MGSFWENIKKTLEKGIKVAAEKTDEYTKIGKIKVDILGIRRNIDKNFTELGSKVYHLITQEGNTRVATNEEVKELIEKVKELEAKLEAKREELRQVQQEKKKEAAEPEKEVETVSVEESQPVVENG